MIFVTGGFNVWLNFPKNNRPSCQNDKDLDLLSFVSAARWWAPSEWAAKEQDSGLKVADDPEAQIVAEDVLPFLFPIAKPERLILYALGACGVKMGPSFVCDDPLLRSFEWQDFALLNGDYLAAPRDFASNLCTFSMSMNQQLFGVLGIRAATCLDNNSTAPLFDVDCRSHSTMFGCELLLTGQNPGRQEPHHAILLEKYKTSEDLMVMASIVVAELNWEPQKPSASYLSLVSLEKAMELFRNAVGNAAPRGVLYATVLLGGVLLHSNKIREAIKVFESTIEILRSGNDNQDGATCLALLFEAYYRLLERFLPVGPNRAPVLGVSNNFFFFFFFLNQFFASVHCSIRHFSKSSVCFFATRSLVL